MNIWAGGKYSIIIENKGGYINEEGTFSDYDDTDIRTLEGGELINYIRDLLTNEDIFDVSISEDRMRFGFYNPNGEGSDLEMRIVEVNE